MSDKNKNKPQNTAAGSMPTFDISKYVTQTSDQELKQGLKAEKVTLPPFVKPDSIPVGAVIIGQIHAIIGDFTGREGMEDCQNLILKLADGELVTIPVTGTLQQSLLRVPVPHVGKTIAIKRQLDGIDAHFKRSMFMFDVWVIGVEQGQLTMGASQVTRRVKKNR